MTKYRCPICKAGEMEESRYCGSITVHCKDCGYVGYTEER